MALWIAMAGGFLLFLLLYLMVITRIAPKVQAKERVQKLSRLTASPGQGRLTEDGESFSERVILPVFRQLDQAISRLAPGQIHQLLAGRIARAGKQHIWSASAFTSLWIFSAVLFMVIMAFYVFSVNHLPFAQGFALVLCALVLGAALPLLFLETLASRRQKAILRQLPEALDLLCVSVQAGLSLDGALAKVTERMHGPLIDEFAKALRDTRMGMTRKLALTSMAERCQLPELHLFVGAVIQSDRLGVSIAKTLVIQAENMRERRRQSVREQALKAPVKMLLPLALFIFPALFVVVLLPTLFSILNNLKVFSR